MIIIRPHGVENTIKNINKMANESEKQLAIKMARVVWKVTYDAKRYAPFRTGFLRNHIFGSVVRRKVWIDGRVRSTAPYSIFQEFGTSRHAAHPYMRPSMIKNRLWIQAQLADALREAMVKSEYKGHLIREKLA